MTALRFNRFASVVAFFACGGVPGAAFGQFAQGYSEYRQSLLADGWRPVTSYGLKTAAGKLLYKYPEVVCGPALCNAKWRDRQGREKLITLQRGQSGEDHRVTPQ